jgi:REP element-mobilizing transposase RayT
MKPGQRLQREKVKTSQAQMEMRLEPKTWGGKREGAGRPRLEKSRVPHGARQPHKLRHPVHVTLRVVQGVGNLRAEQPFGLIRDAIRVAGVGRADFRIVHFAVMSNHLHLIVEANDEHALGRGMQGLSIRIARGLNRIFRRKGTVFTARYHRHDLKSPRETRNALAYVLQNHRKHLAERGRRCARGWQDPCSSAAWFDGWTTGQRRPTEPRLVALPETWLLQVGWKQFGLISPDEVPRCRR